ncbi:MAG: hypothetical protein ACD_58C00139G0005 [uncultured bacterium]|nr:MAG: hypothetical protein ACD_58C00139G0005 [uncultured bacterium]
MIEKHLGFVPTENVTEKEPTEKLGINLYGKEIDEAMLEYAQLVISYKNLDNDRKNNIDRESRINWQSEMRISDSERRDAHNKVRDIMLKQGFFNQIVGDSFEHVSDKEKSDIAMNFISKISELYIMLINLRRGKNLEKISNETSDLESETTSTAKSLESFEYDGLDLLHTQEDMERLFKIEKLLETNRSKGIIYSKGVDASIEDYLEKNKNVIKISRLMSTDSENYYGNKLTEADLEKSESHKKIIKALMNDGYLPQFDIWGLFMSRESWQKVPLVRVIAQQFADTYILFKSQ